MSKKQTIDGKKREYVNDLRYAVDLLDGFRRPPLPIHELLKKQVVKSPLVKPLERTRLNAIILNVSKEKKDKVLEKKWEEFKNVFVKFVPYINEYEAKARRLNMILFLAVGFAVFGTTLLTPQLSLPIWAPGIIGLSVFIVSIYFYRKKDLENLSRLRKRWKLGNLVRELVDIMALHLSTYIQDNNLNPADFTLDSNFKDYNNLEVIEDHKKWYRLAPKVR
ncbi:MAG: hypothetical protein ACP6IU_02370 [Candidatus Asgardarchaeia archaeon]